MPKRTDISTIMIIGAGPIIIGQACEFDYSGTQACKALREEGYRIVLVNSNPATIMTDPDLADRTYVEPITPEIVAKIIEKERGDRSKGFALLPTMGGQTALNCALSLERAGVLERFDVEMIGADAKAIDKAEDRELFRQAMTKIGLATPRSRLANASDLKKADKDEFNRGLEKVSAAHADPQERARALEAYRRDWDSNEAERKRRYISKGLQEGLEAIDDIGLPAIIRPSFTLGGTGGGIAYDKVEFIDIVQSGLDASPTTEVLIEESVLGWKEFEMEVVRDKADNCIIVCSIENVDPMGVHTGDSITVAPALTLTDKEYQIMRDASIAVLREIGVETGGSNVQFAINPANGRMVVIEMNPRVSRSSALASKATGFPIARVAAKLAVGYTLDEIANDITGGATRTDNRLRRHQGAAFRLREVPRRRTAADDRDEVGRRVDGDRPHLRRVAAKGPALAGDGPDRPRPRRDRGAWPWRRHEQGARRAWPPDARSPARRRAGAAPRHEPARHSRGVQV